MTPTEEYYGIEKRLSLVEAELKNVHADVLLHRTEFNEFKAKDFRDTAARWEQQTKSIGDKLEESERRLEDKLDVNDKRYYDKDKGFVTKESFKDWVRDAFTPIRIIVWAVVGMIGGGVITAGLTFLLRKP